MSSSKEGGTAATAQQLGSMSLGKSAAGERKRDNDAVPTAKDTPTKVCSACGKVSDTLKKCTACKCVWYCDKDCQNRHRKEHKQVCKRIKKELDKRGGKLDLGTEKDVGPLGKLPPREECPICMRAMPIPTMFQCYFACCGKTLCSGCDFQHQMKSEQSTCAFCREPMSETDEEVFAQLQKGVERNDPRALHNMAMDYGGYGGVGLQVDQSKCIDLLHQSAGLGYPHAQAQIGKFYEKGDMGLEQNKKEAIKCWETAAEGGDLDSMHNLGGMAHVKGDHAAAMRHWRLSASGGFKLSLKNLIICFEDGLLHHGDLAETLRAFYLERAEITSVDRDTHIAHLKRTGKYEERFDL